MRIWAARFQPRTHYSMLLNPARLKRQVPPSCAVALVGGVFSPYRSMRDGVT